MKKSQKTTWICVSLASLLLIFSIFFNLNNFPRPTGTYGVGKINTHLQDKARHESNYSLAAPRELELIIWYPTDQVTTIPCCYYDADALASAQDFMSSLSRVPLILFKGLDSTKTYAQTNQPISQGQHTYPIIIMPCPPGPMVQNYSWIAEDLASHGYIVIGINHPYLSARTQLPNQRTIKGLYAEKRKEGEKSAKIWKAAMDEVASGDIRFVLDQLSTLSKNTFKTLFDKMDIEHIGICGHSRAGAWIINVCRMEPRIKAAVVMDSIPRGNNATEPVSTPLLILLAEKSHLRSGSEGKKDLETLTKFINASSRVISLTTLPDVGHAVFTDIPLLLRETLFTQFIASYIHVDIDACVNTAFEAQRKSRAMILEFLNRNLNTRGLPQSAIKY